MERKIKRNPSVIWRLEEEKLRRVKRIKNKKLLEELDRGIMFLNIDNRLFELNSIGAEIWLLCDGTKSKKEIAKILSKEYKTSAQKTLKEVKYFINKLTELKLLIS